MLNTKQVYLDTINNGGSSTNLDGEHPTSGYMVALPNCELIVKPDWFNVGTIKQYILDYQDEFFNEQVYLGTWLDANTIYLDVSVNVQNLEDAVKLGHEYGQLAIYDVLNREAITM
jgi:hypothetical protein